MGLKQLTNEELSASNFLFLGNMILSYRNNTLTRYATEGGYATTRDIPVTGDLATLMQSLLTWLSSTLATGEEVTGVVLEGVGQTPSAYTDQTETTTDPAGNVTTTTLQVPSAWRPVISAAVSVTAPPTTAGMRTFVADSESLPSELRDGLVTAWGSLL